MQETDGDLAVVSYPEPAYVAEVVEAQAPTEAAMSGVPPALAYTLDDSNVAPDEQRTSRTRWALSAAALLAAAAAFVVAGAVGARALRDSSSPLIEVTRPTVTQTLPTRTTTLTVPDQDTAFLADLDRAGIDEIFAAPAVHNARAICDRLTVRTRDQILQEIMDAQKGGTPNVIHGNRPLMSWLPKYIELSVEHYCPNR
jgi:hypothetical protein